MSLSSSRRLTCATARSCACARAIPRHRPRSAMTRLRPRGDGPTQGAEWLHVVNLDGAFRAKVKILQLPSVAQNDSSGASLNLNLNLNRLAEIRAAVGLPIQFGGGIRTVDDVARALALGATRVVLGTVAVRQPEMVAGAVTRFGAERIVAGIDARDGRVATHGWQETSALDALTVTRRMADLGVLRIVFTDIARDGMLTGVNVAATAALAARADSRLSPAAASPVWTTSAPWPAHVSDGIEGVIVGQALYTGAVDLAAALGVAFVCVMHVALW